MRIGAKVAITFFKPVNTDPTPFFELLSEDDDYLIAENADFLIIE